MNVILKKIGKYIPPIRRIVSQRNDLADRCRVLSESLGFAPPGHFYSPVISLDSIKEREDHIWNEIPENIPGIDLNLVQQHENLKAFSGYYNELPFHEENDRRMRYFYNNPSYGFCDGICLYSMMRKLRPSNIIEIGCGYTSGLMMDVSEKFLDGKTNISFVEPYPDLLRNVMRINDENKYEIITKKVQNTPANYYRKLHENDILFVDSSHVCKTDSDVNYILFEILPILREGVVVHFHDVFYPFEYPKEWIYNGRFWNEIYLIRAFLQYNDTFEIEFFNSYMTNKNEDFFTKFMPLCLKRQGASLWLRKVKQ